MIENHGNQLKPGMYKGKKYCNKICLLDNKLFICLLGTALVLKNVGIFFFNEMPSVIITEKSLVSMFCNNPASYGINFHRISELKHEDLVKLQAQVDEENKFAQTSATGDQSQTRNTIIPLGSLQSSTSSIGPSASCNSFSRPNHNKSLKLNNTPRNSTPGIKYLLLFLNSTLRF